MVFRSISVGARICYLAIGDCFLVPQVFNAARFEIDMRPYPRIAAIDAACAELPAFIAAHPSRQPDSE